MAVRDNDLPPEDPDLPPDGDLAPLEPVERPLTGRAKATQIFFELIKDCGPDLIRMPSSCVVYLSRYLANYPDEADLLALVVRAKIPTILLQHEKKHGYAELYDHVLKEFAQNERLAWEDAKWAVETWAQAIGRPRGFKYRKPKLTREDLYPDPDAGKKYDNFVKAAMIFIVGLGGFFGTFMAVALVPLVLWAMEGGLVALTGGLAGGLMDDEAGDSDAAMFLIAFIVAAGFGIVGAAAAVVAWIFAGGEERPWDTAAVASGTAFFTVFVCLFLTMMCCIPPLFLPFVHICCVFSATYKSAARGGHY
jgi:hypothetical protein